MQKKNIDIKIIQNFANGKYSYNDYLKIKDWFINLPEDSRLEHQLFLDWEEVSNKNVDNVDSLDHIFERIERNILLAEKRYNNKRTFWNLYKEVAAILIIPVLAFALWQYISGKSNQFNLTNPQNLESWITINSPDGARTEFFLPDGTKGWLNSGSKLKYPAIFNNQRKVELIGEAWFDVSHTEHSEFLVSVPEMDISVFGTTFNVSAYKDDNFTNVVLEEGRVKIEGKEGLFEYSLLPNEKITFDRESKSVKVSVVNAKSYSAWKDGYLVIDDETLGKAISRLERWYNIDAEIKDEALSSYHFKATFKDEQLEEVLKLIAETTPINYKIEKRVINKNGVLAKKKVIINLN